MSRKLRYIKVGEATPLDSHVLLQIRTGTATGSQLVATVHTSLDASLRAVREKLVEIAVKGTVASSMMAAGALTAESAAVAGLSLEEVKSIVSHRLHAFDMSCQFQFVFAGGCLAYTSEQEQRTSVHDAIPTVPSYGLPSTGPSWLMEPKAGSVVVNRRHKEATSLTINVSKDAETGHTMKASNALLVLYVRQGDGGAATGTTALAALRGARSSSTSSLIDGGHQQQQDCHSERIIMERLLMSDVPFGKTLTPRHLSLLVSRWNINTRDLLGRTILHECCADGNLPAVRYLLSLSHDVPIVPDEVDFGGRTCLHYAVLGGHLEVVNELLARNGDPSLRPSGRRFHFTADANAAIATTEEELASVGRALPFNPLHPDYMGRTPLHSALSLRHDALTEQLCNAIAALPFVVLRTMHQCVYNLYYGQSAPVGRGLVGAQLEAVNRKVAEKMEDVFRNGAMAAVASKAARLQWQGEERFASITNLFATLSPSLLQLAAEGNIEAMVVLLSHPLFDKASALQRGPTGESLLHLASRKGHTDMVRFLVSDDYAELFPQNDLVPTSERSKEGAMLDECGRTPIHYACMSGHADTLLELLRHATASSAQTAAAQTVTSEAAGGEGDDDDDDDERALIISDGVTRSPPRRGAAASSNVAAPQAHLPNLDVNAIDVCGCTALHWALRNGHVDCARVLLEVYREAVGTASGLIVSVADQHGMGPLHIAAASGADDVVHTLVEDYRIHPNTRVLTSTAYKSRSAPSARDVARRKESSQSSGSQLLEAGVSPTARSSKSAKVIVRTLGPSPLWLALQEGHHQTATLLIDLGAVSEDFANEAHGVLPSIIDLDLTMANDDKGVPIAEQCANSRREYAKQRSSNAADGNLFMSPSRASRMPPPPSSRPPPTATREHVAEAQFWHLRAMLIQSLNGNWLSIAQILLAAMHHKGFGERLAGDSQLLIAFTAKRNDYGLRWLIDRGVGRDSHSQRDGVTVLSACCYARNVEAVRYLLEAVPDINVNCGADAHGVDEGFTTTPLYLAVASSRHESASAELVELLFRKGAGGYSSSTAAITSAPSLSTHTPRASLYRPLVQAALRGDFGIVQTLCGYESTTPRDAAVALWWLLNTVPATSDGLFVRRTVAKVLEEAEGPYNKHLRQVFGEPPSLAALAPRNTAYSPSAVGVSQYDAIAVALFRKVRFVAESPIHPFEFLHLASSKLWHFGALVQHIVSALRELPMDVKRAIVDTSSPLDASYSHKRVSPKEAAASGIQQETVRVGHASAGAFIGAMSDGSYTPYHRLVNRDVFANILRNGPTTSGGMNVWYPILRLVVEECGVFPLRVYDYTQRSCADYALMGAHGPSMLYVMVLGLLPLHQNLPKARMVATKQLSGALDTTPIQGRDATVAALGAARSEIVSYLFKHREVDYASGTRVVKSITGEAKRPPVPNRRGKVVERHRPRREAPIPIPLDELQEAAALATLLVLVRRGEVTSIRGAFAALAAVCRVTDFSPLARANVGASGPVHKGAAAMALRITTTWGVPLVLCALECNRPLIAKLLLEEFRLGIAAPVLGSRINAISTEAHQLVPNAIALGCDVGTLAVLLEHKAPLAVPSTLTRRAQHALSRRIAGVDERSKFTSLFIAAAFGRMDVLRLLYATVCANEAATMASYSRYGGLGGDGGGDPCSDRFAQIFTLADSAEPATGVCYDALSAVFASTLSSASHASTLLALEMAHFLITKGGWPYVNPYLLRVAAHRSHFELCQLLLQCYGPSIVVADLKVRAAEVAEEERVLREKKGLPNDGADNDDGINTSSALCALGDEELLNEVRVDGFAFASPEKIKGLSRCSAVSAIMRHIGASVGGCGANSSGLLAVATRNPITNKLSAADGGNYTNTRGAATLRLMIDLLALTNYGFSDKNRVASSSPSVLGGAAAAAADVDADREVDTIDERLERLKHELQASIKAFGGVGSGGAASARGRMEGEAASAACTIGLQRHNVRLPSNVMSLTTQWDALLLNHKPSLLKGVMISGTHKGLAGYLALLAFCTQPLAKVAPPVQTLVIKGRRAHRQGEDKAYGVDKSTPQTVQQLMSLLFELTHKASAAALVPADGYQRLVFILKAVIRRNQPMLLGLLLSVSVAVITKACLSDLRAMRETTAESLYYLTLQHADGECTAAVAKAIAAAPQDAYLRTLCYGTDLWSSEVVAVPYASAVCQLARLGGMGRVERAPRGQLINAALGALTGAKGAPLRIALLDVSTLHSKALGAASSPNLVNALRPYLAQLPGGVVVVAASPLLIAVTLGQDELVHQLVASKALDAQCSNSRAYASLVDFKATVAYNKELMGSPDERKRLVFLRDSELSSSLPLPVVNVAVALCLRAATRVFAATAASDAAVRSNAVVVRASSSASPTSPEAAFAVFKRHALTVRALFRHGALHADNVAVMSVAVGHIVRLLSGLRVPAASRVAIGAARAELLDTFLQCAAAACGAKGGPFLGPVRLTDRRKHLCLFTSCDLTNNRHMLHALLSTKGFTAANNNTHNTSPSSSSSPLSAPSPIDADMLKAVLKCTSPSDIENARDDKGRSALCYLMQSAATSSSHAAIVDALLKARPTARLTPCHQGRGWTVLMVACRRGRTDALLSSLLSLTELQAVDNYSRTPLWHACAGGHVQTVRIVMDYIKANGALLADYFIVEDRNGLNPLLAAAANGRDDAVMKLLEYIPAKLVFRMAKNSHWEEGGALGTTLMHAAARGGCVRLTQYMLDLQGKAPAEFAKLISGIVRPSTAALTTVSPFRQIAPFTVQDSNGLSALSIASYSGHVAVLTKLLTPLRHLVLGGSAGAASFVNPNSANTTLAALTKALGGIPESDLSAVDKALLTGRAFNPFTGVVPSAAAVGIDPSDPLELARLREEARQCCDDADEAAAKDRRMARKAYRMPLPIGWFGAAMRLDAMLSHSNSSSNGGSMDAFASPITLPLSKEPSSLLRWCVSNRFTAGIRVCHDLGLGDGVVGGAATTTVLHMAAKRLDLEAAQLLLSLEMSSPFALDRYGSTPLDLCLRAGMKADAAGIACGVDEPCASDDTSPASMTRAERCARFLISKMFAKPAVMAQFKLPDGTLYIHTLFQKVAATRMPGLINAIESRLLGLAGSGSSSPAASAVFVLQMLQRQDSESKRCDTIMKKIRAETAGGGEADEAGNGSTAFGGRYAAYGADAGDGTSEGGHDDEDASLAFNSDLYSAFEVSLLHGCSAMVLRIAEVIRSLATVAAKGTNYGLGGSGNDSRFGQTMSSTYGGPSSSSSAEPMHPLGNITLSASFIRDHLTAISPSIRAILYDLFRVTSVATGCGMQEGIGLSKDSGDADSDEDVDSSDDDGDSSSSSSSSSSAGSESHAGAASAPAAAGGDASVHTHHISTVEAARLSFADVRMIGIGDMHRQPTLSAHVSAIYTLQHERGVLDKELLPMLLATRETMLLQQQQAANGGTHKKSKHSVALSSPSSSASALRIEVDDSIMDLPDYLQRQAMQCMTTNAIAGRYAALDTLRRFPFVSSIVVRFVTAPEEATGLTVSSEGPSRLIDTIALVDGYVVVGAEEDAAGLLFGGDGGYGGDNFMLSPITADVGTGAISLAASGNGVAVPRCALDVNEAVEVTIGAHLPVLRKRLDAKCRELTEFFSTTARTLPAWRAFTPLHHVAVRVEWFCGATGSSGGVAMPIVPVDVQAAIGKLLGTFGQRSSAMGLHRTLADEMERAMLGLLSPEVLGGRLDPSALSHLNTDGTAARAKGRSASSSPSSILELIQATLVGAGYGGTGAECPQAPTQGATRSICFSFVPTSNVTGPTKHSSSTFGGGGARASLAGNGLLMPLKSTDVIAKHRDGSELVIPFCTFGIGRPYLRGDGTAALEPIMHDPLLTFLSPIVSSIERAGAMHAAHQLKDECFLKPMLTLIEARGSGGGAKRRRSARAANMIPSAVKEFCSFVRFKLELEDDASSLGSVRLSQVQTALNNLAAVLADIAGHLPSKGVDSGDAAASPAGPLTATSSLGTDPRSIVPAAMARNLFNTVKAITVVYTTAPNRAGMLRRVPAGSSGAGKADSIGDGAKIVLVVTARDGHQYGRIREQLWFDTLRIEMARVTQLMSSTVADLRHQLSAYYPTADFAIPFMGTWLSGGPIAPPATIAADGSVSSSADVATFVATAERALYQSELLRLSPNGGSNAPSLVLQPLIKGLAVGWDTMLGSRLRDVIKRVDVCEPLLCPSPNYSTGPSIHGATALSFDAVTGTVRYECPALYYPPPKHADTIGSLVVGHEGLAGQLLVAISGSVDFAKDVEMGRPFGPLCTVKRSFQQGGGAAAPHYAAPRKAKQHGESQEEGPAPIAITSPEGGAASWVVVAGERFTFGITLANILGITLGDGVRRHNKACLDATREALMLALDTAIASGALGHVNVAKHLKQVEAKVRTMGRAVRPDWAPETALRITAVCGATGARQHLVVNGADGAADAEATTLLTDFAVECDKAEGAMRISFTAPQKAGRYTLYPTLYGTAVDCGSAIVLSVVPNPSITQVAEEAVFPKSASFFTGRPVAGGHVSAIARNAPFTATIRLSDAFGNSGGSACTRIKTIVVGEPLTETYRYREEGEGAGSAAPPTTRLSVALQGPNEDQLRILKARLVFTNAAKATDGGLLLELTLISGAAQKAPKSSPSPSASASCRSGTLTRKHSKAALRRAAVAGESEDEDEEGDSPEGDDGNGFRLDNVTALLQLGQAETIDTTATCVLFKSLAVLGKSEWMSAEAARRGILGDLTFMRESSRRVEKAIVAFHVRLLEAGDDKAKLKQVAKDGPYLSYDKMKRRLTERCALYFRRTTRRAQLARRQTEAATSNIKGMVVPRRMLHQSLNSQLRVDEPYLLMKATIAFEVAENRRAMQRRKQLRAAKRAVTDDHNEEY